MENMKWYTGCSGFYYKEWKDSFYPKGLPQSRWFEYYARQFNTLEINNTFYKFPELKLFENWYKKAPDGFVFSVKVPGIITHFKQFKDTETLLNDFYSLAREGLKEKLGCILFQLPPKMSFSLDLIQNIIRQTNMFFKNVIEFRHITWWRKDVINLLKEQNIIFCGVSYPGLINDVMSHTPVSYYRFHGVPKLYYSLYENSFLQKVIDGIKAGPSSEAYIYFNNTATGAAIENAKWVEKYLAGTDEQGTRNMEL